MVTFGWSFILVSVCYSRKNPRIAPGVSIVLLRSILLERPVSKGD
jgi:hypothetical protein